MSFILTVTLCSALMQECMKPITYEEKFKDYHKCAIAGYSTAAQLFAEGDPKQINYYRTVITFTCEPDNSNNI